jgi:hypothetical protein
VVHEARAHVLYVSCRLCATHCTKTIVNTKRRVRGARAARRTGA